MNTNCLMPTRSRLITKESPSFCIQWTYYILFLGGMENCKLISIFNGFFLLWVIIDQLVIIYYTYILSYTGFRFWHNVRTEEKISVIQRFLFIVLSFWTISKKSITGLAKWSLLWYNWTCVLCQKHHIILNNPPQIFGSNVGEKFHVSYIILEFKTWIVANYGKWDILMGGAVGKMNQSWSQIDSGKNTTWLVLCFYCALFHSVW